MLMRSCIFWTAFSREWQRSNAIAGGCGRGSMRCWKTGNAGALGAVAMEPHIAVVERAKALANAGGYAVRTSNSR